ncbi:MAG TPA: response regulator transcription factor [Solirubrobacteraceae bacterium]|jgi:DNA-binding response OmpR family regulator
MSRSRVLVVDEDVAARELLRGVLERAGHEVREAEGGRAGLRELYAKPPDLVILDVTIPELDGWATLERIRDLSDVPVLMLTACESELECVRGLRGGADDYVIKPCGHQELTARVQALLRRAGPREDEQRTYADQLVTIDFAQRVVTYGGQEVRLTPQEFKLLAVLVRHPNNVLSRDQLLELVWGDPDGVSPEQVKLYVGYLRHKLDPLAAETTPIETVRGFGYRYRRPS